MSKPVMTDEAAVVFNQLPVQVQDQIAAQLPAGAYIRGIGSGKGAAIIIDAVLPVVQPMSFIKLNLVLVEDEGSSSSASSNEGTRNDDHAALLTAISG
jgi:hypothetical protein